MKHQKIHSLMSSTPKFLSVCFGLYLITSCSHTEVHPVPFFDGDCSEYEALGATIHKMDAGHQIYEFHMRDAVYFCVPLHRGSFGMTEIEVESKKFARPQILHISAQLGNWGKADEAAKPTDPNSDLWWDISGWYANAAAFNGTETENGEVYPKFKSSKGREIVMKKSHFGDTGWTMRFDWRGLVDEAGVNQSFLYPAKDESPLVVSFD